MAPKFDPTAKTLHETRVEADARVVPYGRGESQGMTRPAGVFAQDGEYIHMARCMRSEKNEDDIAAGRSD